MAKQLTIAEQIVKKIEELAKEEAWLEHYLAVGIAAPRQEEVVAGLRAELASLREKAGMRS